MVTVGPGAFRRPKDIVGWQGGLYTMQTQIGLPVHVGALTALSFQGYAHYVRLSAETIFLFSPPKVNLPAWFRHQDWRQPVNLIKTSLLPREAALVDYQVGQLVIKISSPERAFLECLHLTPNVIDLLECYQVIEGLTTLRPKVLQFLLESCSSIKVKRLFLFMASKAGHVWAKRLDTTTIDLGKGARTIVKGGVYVAEFGLTIPKELHKL